MPSRQARQHANDLMLMATVLIFFGAIVLILLAVAGVWTPPGWETP